MNPPDSSSAPVLEWLIKSWSLGSENLVEFSIRATTRSEALYQAATEARLQERRDRRDGTR